MKLKSKNKRGITVIAIVLALLIALSSFISIYKFNVRNPFKAGIGLIQILTTDKEYVELQSSPKVVIGQPDEGWQMYLNYLSSEGYTYIENERAGGIYVIEKDGIKEYFTFTVNAYYSKWVWDN